MRSPWLWARAVVAAMSFPEKGMKSWCKESVEYVGEDRKLVTVIRRRFSRSR